MEPLLDKLARQKAVRKVFEIIRTCDKQTDKERVTRFVVSTLCAPKPLLIGGFLMAPVCFFLLVYGQFGAWVICPQALVVMFVRQSQHGYDSLGAAGLPDLAVALLYFPFVGWLLSRASKAGRFRQVAVRVAFWHIAAIALAFATGEIRDWIWGFEW